MDEKIFKIKSDGKEYFIYLKEDNITDALEHIASKNGINGVPSVGCLVWIPYASIDGIERMIQ